MNKIIIISVLAFFIGFNVYADNDRDGTQQIYIQHKHSHNHSEYYPPADMPEVYLGLDDMEIIIEADGFADYYVVNIISQVSMQSVIYTQIGGFSVEKGAAFAIRPASF